MKQCPQCKRTYADETITFCLVDGAILSAPYVDVPPTQEAPAPTVRLPHTTKPQVPETIPAQPSPLPSPTPPPSLAVRRSERSGSVYIVIALVVLLLGGLVTFFVLRTRRANQRQQGVNVNISTSPSDRAQSEKDLQAITDIPPANPTPSRSPSPKNPKPPSISVDPKLFPPDATPSPHGTPSPGKSAASTEDRVFNGNEVTQKARVISKPEPQYTEEARKNQITGTVVLKVVFTAGGQVTNITAIRALPYGLTEKAMAAARQIRFVPAMKDGRPVSMYMLLEYNFNLY